MGSWSKGLKLLHLHVSMCRFANETFSNLIKMFSNGSNLGKHLWSPEKPFGIPSLHPLPQPPYHPQGGLIGIFVITVHKISSMLLKLSSSLSIFKILTNGGRLTKAEPTPKSFYRRPNYIYVYPFFPQTWGRGIMYEQVAKFKNRKFLCVEKSGPY